jgi:oxygen-dependent protoporphyrinogen oxidase
LIEPLMSGIYAGDGDLLSLASTFPYLRDLELKYGSLARGALKMRAQSNGKSVQGSRSAFLTPGTGLAEIVERLLECLAAEDVALRLNTTAFRVVEYGAGYQVVLATGETLEAEAVILATPAFVSGSLLTSLDPGLASGLQSIPYASTATVTLAYRQSDIPRDLDGYGYVIPRREGRRALACTWTSTKFPHRAPEGYALIRIFIGRAGQDIPWHQNDVLALAKEEVQLTLGIAAEPLLSRVFMWEKAMPQYNLGHPEILKQIDTALEAHPGLALAGNGYRGIGIPDCIRSGELAVQKTLETRKVASSAAF